MREGFLGNAATFEIFFRLCRRYKINGEKERIDLLRKLTAKKKLKYIRDGESFIKGKAVLKLNVPKRLS